MFVGLCLNLLLYSSWILMFLGWQTSFTTMTDNKVDFDMNIYAKMTCSSSNLEISIMATCARQWQRLINSSQSSVKSAWSVCQVLQSQFYISWSIPMLMSHSPYFQFLLPQSRVELSRKLQLIRSPLSQFRLLLSNICRVNVHQKILHRWHCSHVYWIVFLHTVRSWCCWAGKHNLEQK